MNYPYSSFIVEAQIAQYRLGQMFQARPDCPSASPSLTKTEGASAMNDPQATANRPTVLRDVLSSRAGHHDPKNRASSNRSHWTREDMGTFSFTLTLLLLGTVAAAQTDQPALWLLVGPGLLAVGLVAAPFFRRRLNLSVYLRGFRHRSRRSGQSRERRPGGSCRCQCQCH
jgi:hypothetical protein